MEEVNEKQIKEELRVKAEKAKRAQWVKEGREKQSARKSRNHAIIQAGLGVMKMIEAGELDMEKLLPHVVINKQDIVKQWILNESSKK